jgi:hypothetical protein
MKSCLTQGCLRFCLCALLAVTPVATFPQKHPGTEKVPIPAANSSETQLHRAARTGNLVLLRLQLKNGADPNVRDKAGCTPLMYAAEQGQLGAARVLLKAGADPNVVARGWGSALETAERNGHIAVAALLRKAGARSSGHSLGDTVCVRPWNGDGYCGVVQAVNKTAYRIRVTQIVGCKDGCPSRQECSDGRIVGGPGGIAVGDAVNTVSWCLTHTGVKP